MTRHESVYLVICFAFAWALVVYSMLRGIWVDTRGATESDLVTSTISRSTTIYHKQESMTSKNTSTHPLFSPIKIGNMNLKHRVVMCPLTRYRNDDDHVPTDMMVEYYTQRASTPGTMLITEASFISRNAGGLDNAPGIWSKQQIEAWKKVTNAVHGKGSFIVLQLWALGRGASPDSLAREAESLGLGRNALPYVSASDVLLESRGHGIKPRPVTVEEIDEYVEWFGKAAKNAIEAGFDAVEVHNANGYLLDQFLQDVTNKRSDEYGGSIEARAKFPLRVLDSVVKAIGQERVGIRVSPWNDYQEMRMSDPIPMFSYFVGEIRRRYERLAYLHVVEGIREGDSNEFLRNIWHDNNGKEAVFLSAGEHNRESALKHAEEKGDVVAFGKWFISNPDLPIRLKEDIPLTPYDSSTFYARKSPKGYIDYPFAQILSQANETVVLA